MGFFGALEEGNRKRSFLRQNLEKKQRESPRTIRSHTEIREEVSNKGSMKRGTMLNLDRIGGLQE